MRIGQGFDAHRFGEGDHIVVGGVRIPFDRGVEAHSDGDVLIHALCDALLGAAGLGDIGHHFPDTDPRYRNADSRALLRHVRTRVAEQGLVTVNVDTTVIAQAPRLAPHVPAMRGHVAEDLGIDAGCVSIKATTTEGMGFIGRAEGLAALAVACLAPVDSA